MRVGDTVIFLTSGPFIARDEKGNKKPSSRDVKISSGRKGRVIRVMTRDPHWMVSARSTRERFAYGSFVLVQVNRHLVLVAQKFVAKEIK